MRQELRFYFTKNEKKIKIKISQKSIEMSVFYELKLRFEIICSLRSCNKSLNCVAIKNASSLKGPSPFQLFDSKPFHEQSQVSAWSRIESSRGKREKERKRVMSGSSGNVSRNIFPRFSQFFFSRLFLSKSMVPTWRWFFVDVPLDPQDYFQKERKSKKKRARWANRVNRKLREFPGKIPAWNQILAMDFARILRKWEKTNDDAILSH